MCPEIGGCNTIFRKFMQSIYLATIFAGALVCLLSSLLLLVRRKSGERSRLILALIVFFSVLNYIPRFIAVSIGYDSELVVSTKMLLIGNFMVVSYIMYPIEVIRPRWLNFSRIVQLSGHLLLCRFPFAQYGTAQFQAVYRHNAVRLFSKGVSWRHTSVGYPVSIFEEMAWIREL